MTDDQVQDLVGWLDSVRDDPVAFVEGAFDWGHGELEGSTGPEPWQRWLLEEIRDGLLKPGEAVRIAISSGHGIGKSAVCAWITLWAISTFPGARGLITASSEAMLMTRLRAELRIWYRRFKAQEFFELTATSLISADPSHAQTWRADLLAWSENRPEAMAGLHSKGGRLLVLFDEASAIPGTIWDTVEPITTDALQAIWIATGNPLHPVGRFRDVSKSILIAGSPGASIAARSLLPTSCNCSGGLTTTAKTVTSFAPGFWASFPALDRPNLSVPNWSMRRWPASSIPLGPIHL